MLYSAPSLGRAERAVIASLYALAGALVHDGNQSDFSFGLLGRQVFERAGGNARALAANASAANPLLAEAGADDWRALEGYRRALRQAAEPAFGWSVESILALHAMMTEHDRRALGGEWRTESVKVLNVYGEVVYAPPDADEVPLRMRELADYLNRQDGEAAVVKAAIAHLNVVRIHPFRDGNGRMGRCLQAAILLREGVLGAKVASLEEYIGRYTRAYNDALESTGASWEPARDTRAWTRFCLTAHYRQAIELVRNALKLACLAAELNTCVAKALAEKAAIELGEIFGAKPEVIRRWWRMRPQSVIESFARQTREYRLRARPARGEPREPATDHGELAALLRPANLGPATPAPDPFEVFENRKISA